MRAKLAKIAIYGFTGILFLLAGVYTVLLSPPVQLWITQKFTVQLSQQLHTSVSVAGVDFEFFNKLVLEDVVVEGYNNDTMFRAAVLKLSIAGYNGKKQVVNLNQLVLDDAELNFVKFEGEDDFNYEKVIEYLNGEPSTDTTSEFKPWTINSGSVVLEGVTFRYRDRNYPPPTDRKFDENYLEFSNIIANLSDFTVINDSISFHTKHLGCNERSGLVVEHLKGDMIISRTTMHYKNLSLKTPHSMVTDDIVFEYSSWRDMNDFISKVYIEGNLKNAYVDFDDLKLFSNELNNFDERVYLDGLVRGRIDNFKAKDFTAAFGNSSHFSGDLSFNGLPYIDETFIDIKFEKTHTNENDIKRLVKGVDLPENFKYFGDISFDGYFTGFYKDFVAYGIFNTAIGEIKSNINLKIKGDENNSEYSGTFATNEFNIGKFYDLGETVGEVTLNAKIKGKGFNVNNFDVEMEGEVQSLLASGYNYKNIGINGKLAKDLFTGSAKLDDENGKVDFDGTIDFGGKKPILDFSADVDSLNLMALHIEPNTKNLKVKLQANFEGLSIDDLNGKISFNDLSFNYADKNYGYQEGKLEATSKDNRKALILTSDMADARIEGEYNIENLVPSIQDLVASYIPYIVEPSNNKLPKENFTFSAKLKKPKEFSELFLNNVTLGSMLATGSYNSEAGNLRIDGSLAKLRVDNYEARNISLLLEKAADSTLQTRILTDNFYDGDSIVAADINILSKITPNKINFDVKIRDTAQTLAAFVKGDFKFESDTMVSTIFTDAELYLEQQRWDISTPQPVYIQKDKYVFNDLLLKHKNQSLAVNGIASAGDDTLVVNFKQFDFFDLKKLIDYTGPDLAGTANGKLDIQRVLANPYIVADLSVSNFSLDGDTLGDFTVYSNTTDINEQLKVNVKAVSGKLKNFTVSGFVNYAKNSTNNMDLRVYLPLTNTNILDAFLYDEVNFIGGTLASQLTVKGMFDKPEVKGYVDFADAKFRYNFTNTVYSFSQKVTLDNKLINAGKFDLIDDRGKVAKVEGKVTHKDYSNFVFDLFVSDLKDYHVLNTDYPNNPGFYGNAYADGNMRVTGPLEDVTIDIYAKSKPGSWVSISVEDDDMVKQSSYITFVNPNEVKQVKKQESAMITGVNLNMNLELTKEMQGGIVFDRGAGDSIAGIGSGNLALKINTYGDFTMYGNYVIENGDYAFTALDFIKRKFKIQNGSKIAWNGDPYEAILDIIAVYKTNAILNVLTAGIVSDRDAQAYNGNIPVEALLNIKGSLLQPEITFGIDFEKLEKEVGTRTSGNEISTIFKRIEANQDELNRQVFSLLVLNSFAPPTFANATAADANLGSGAVSRNVSQMISNQLTNVLSQYSKDFEIGLDYYAGSVDRNQEIILSLKKTYGRLVIQGAIDAANTSQNTQFDVNVEYSITEDGRIKARAYSSSNNHPVFQTNVITNGVGFYLIKKFEHFSDLFKWLQKGDMKEEESTIDPEPDSSNTTE